MMSKQCTKCKETKLFSEFSQSNPTKKDGHNSWCKACCRGISKRHRLTASGVYSALKGRTTFRRKNVNRYSSYHPLTISRGDFIDWYNTQERKCAYCDLDESELDKIKDVYNDRKSDRLTIDCKTNSRGYSKGNLVLACKRCNTMKSDILSYEEMREIGQKYIKPKWLNTS